MGNCKHNSKQLHQGCKRKIGENKMNECKNCKKLESKLKMMEISFELINNSRNDLIKQLAEQELLNEKLQEKIK